ncbi:hypothetical protein [Haloferula sp.]|uniref:hypothetical protein n=1 Tax=Haloferula sp. TaxID=2497595 RepID=UPI003C726E34
MIVTFLVRVIVTFMAFTMIRMLIAVSLMKDLRFLPTVPLTRNGSKEQAGGEQVKSFHLRRV